MYKIQISKPNGEKHYEFAKDERGIDRTIEYMHSVYGDVFGIDISYVEDEMQTKTKYEKLEDLEEQTKNSGIYIHFSNYYLLYSMFTLGTIFGYIARLFVE